MFGSLYDGQCVCAKCLNSRGEKTREIFNQIEKPDYSVLLKPSFWAHAFTETAKSS